MTPHPQAEILHAIADGKTVQIRNALRGSDKWFDESNPFEYINDDRFEFRIKTAIAHAEALLSFNRIDK